MEGTFLDFWMRLLAATILPSSKTYCSVIAESKQQRALMCWNQKVMSQACTVCAVLLHGEGLSLFFKCYCIVLVFLWVHFVFGNFSVPLFCNRYSVSHSFTVCLLEPAYFLTYITTVLKVAKPWRTIIYIHLIECLF